MTYSINVSGHGATADDAKEVFADLVRALRAINAASIGDAADGVSNDGYISGQIGGMAIDGMQFSLNANDVVDIEAADTDETDDSPESVEVPEADEPIGEDNDGEA